MTAGQEKQLVVHLLTMLDPSLIGFEATQYLLSGDKGLFAKTLASMINGLVPSGYGKKKVLTLPLIFPDLKPLRFFDWEWTSVQSPALHLSHVKWMLEDPHEDALKLSLLEHSLDWLTFRYFWSRDRRGETKLFNEWEGMCVVGWRDGRFSGEEKIFPVLIQLDKTKSPEIRWYTLEYILDSIEKKPEIWPLVIRGPWFENR